MVNPLAMVASTARQFNEQANTMVKGLADSVTQGANQFLQVTSKGLPALPGLPGAQGNSGGGNPNGGLPTPQQLLAQPLQAVSQAEDVILPKGFPRVATQLLQATRQQRRTVVSDERPPPDRQPSPAAPTRGLSERRGI